MLLTFPSNVRYCVLRTSIVVRFSVLARVNIWRYEKNFYRAVDSKQVKGTEGGAMDFYAALEYVLKQQGITAAELSRRTGIRKQYFSDLKSGRTTDVSWSKAVEIVTALGMSLDEFAAIEDSLVR